MLRCDLAVTVGPAIDGNGERDETDAPLSRLAVRERGRRVGQDRYRHAAPPRLVRRSKPGSLCFVPQVAQANDIVRAVALRHAGWLGRRRPGGPGSGLMDEEPTTHEHGARAKQYELLRGQQPDDWPADRRRKIGRGSRGERCDRQPCLCGHVHHGETKIAVGATEPFLEQAGGGDERGRGGCAEAERAEKAWYEFA